MSEIDIMASNVGQKVFSLAEANAALPLIRVIVRDITALAAEMRDRHQRWQRLTSSGSLDQAHQEEVQHMAEDLEVGQEKMESLIEELRSLHVEMKDPFTGLVDFPCVMEGRVVYLCWKMDEAQVAHWHELWTGFAGRKKLTPQCVKLIHSEKA
jgi:hypothetical protein